MELGWTREPYKWSCPAPGRIAWLLPSQARDKASKRERRQENGAPSHGLIFQPPRQPLSRGSRFANWVFQDHDLPCPVLHQPKSCFKFPNALRRILCRGTSSLKRYFHHLNTCQAKRHWGVLLSRDNHIPRVLASTKCSCGSDPLGAVTSSQTVLPPALKLPSVPLRKHTL